MGVIMIDHCLMPQAINKCFDWDIYDTRWTRVGMTLGEAYATLGVRQTAACYLLLASCRLLPDFLLPDYLLLLLAPTTCSYYLLLLLAPTTCSYFLLLYLLLLLAPLLAPTTCSYYLLLLLTR